MHPPFLLPYFAGKGIELPQNFLDPELLSEKVFWIFPGGRVRVSQEELTLSPQPALLISKPAAGLALCAALPPHSDGFSSRRHRPHFSLASHAPKPHNLHAHQICLCMSESQM